MSKLLTYDSIVEICKKPTQALLEAPWHDKGFYAEWLAQTGHFVKHSTRLLTLAAAHCNEEQTAYHNRFIPHAAEEKGHDKLTIMDLKNMNLDFKNFPEAAATQSLYQPQYYWIQFKSPLAFFGYILCLEVIAKNAGPFICERTTKEHGPKASHFIRVHAEEDEEHVEEAMKMVAGITGPDETYIMQSLIQGCDNYVKMLEYCRTKASAEKYRAAG